MVSFYYILKNEADNIIKSLESIKDYADEIVICIDNATTDDTYDVIDDWYCRTEGVGYKQKTQMFIYHFNWTGYADARNFAISKCNGEYIICIDGDEILEYWEQPNGDYTVCTIADEIQGRTTYFPAIRCFKNGIGVKYEGLIQAIPDLSLRDKTAGTAKIQIRHFGYDMTKDEMIAKTKSNLEKHLNQLLEEPENLTVEFYISQCYRFLGDFQSGIDYGMLAMHKPINTITRALLYINLYLCYKGLGKDFFAVKWLMKSIEKIPMQILSRIYLINEIENIDLKKQHFEIIEKLTINKQSQLPNDIYYSQSELEEIRSRIWQ